MGRGEDRISHLPNEILQSILCLMPLKYAIRTSTLSKKWRNLWKINLISSTSLRFGEDFSCGQSPNQFSETIDWYLQLHGNRNLDQFGILLSPFEYFFPNLENWVRTVIAKGVKELDIDLSYGVPDYNPFSDSRMPFVISGSLFNCSSLTHLSLSMCNFSDPFDSANFASLNSLSLDLVNIDDDMFRNILQTCISLESISLKRCDYMDMATFVGDKLKLRKLALLHCTYSYVNISAPKLESFVFHGFWWTHSFGNVSNVTDACLYLTADGANEEKVSDLLLEFSHVKILTLGAICLTDLADEEEYNEDIFPVELCNLQELQLILDYQFEQYCLNSVFSFFRRCPSPYLEKLFIQCQSNLDEKDDISISVIAEIEIPVFQNLKWIKITNFKGSPLHLNMVKLLLEKAVMLESIFLVMNQCDNKPNRSSSLQSQLSILPKASTDADIVICGPSDHDCTMNPTHRTY